MTGKRIPGTALGMTVVLAITMQLAATADTEGASEAQTTDWQSAAQELYDDYLQSQHPDLAGFWLDEENGTVNISFIRNVDAHAREARSEYQADPDRIRATTAQRTLNSLEETRRSVVEDSSPNTAAQMSAVYVDHEANDVVVALDPAESSSRNEEAQTELRSHHGDRLRFIHSSKVGPAHTPNTCASYLSCQNPHRARGVMRIYQPGINGCSVGFWILDDDLVTPLFVTAGHCGGVGSVWYHDGIRVGTFRQSDPAGPGAGTQNDPALLDGAVLTDERIEGDNRLIHSPALTRTRATGTYNNNNAPAGMTICDSGATSTGPDCHALISGNATIQRSDGVWYHNQLYFPGCVAGGDSGGPIYTHSGGTDTAAQYGVLHAGLCDGGDNNRGVGAYIVHFRNHFGVVFVTAGVHGW